MPRESGSELAADGAAAYPPELSQLVEREERISAIAVEVAGLQKELARLRGDSETLRRLLDERQAELADRDVSWTQLANESARARGGEAEVRASLAVTEKQLDDSRAQVVTLESELQAARSRVDELEDALAASEPAAELPARAHVCVVGRSSGYVLSEHEEPPPSVGDIVEVDGSRFGVARIGRSPLPADARPCAFLVSEPELAPTVDDPAPLLELSSTGPALPMTG